MRLYLTTKRRDNAETSMCHQKSATFFLQIRRVVVKGPLKLFLEIHLFWKAHLIVTAFPQVCNNYMQGMYY